MASVFNPTNALVNHNINGRIYKIAPGGTCEVGEGDLDDLLKLLGFLTVVETAPTGEKVVSEVVVDAANEIDLVPRTEKEIEAREAKRPKEYRCDEQVEIVNEATGRKTVTQCGFTATKKRALLAHIRNDHPKSKPSVGSLNTEEASREELDEDGDGVTRRRGRPKKSFA